MVNGSPFLPQKCPGLDNKLHGHPYPSDRMLQRGFIGWILFTAWDFKLSACLLLHPGTKPIAALNAERCTAS